jgi:hypothetical protein
MKRVVKTNVVAHLLIHCYISRKTSSDGRGPSLKSATMSEPFFSWRNAFTHPAWLGNQDEYDGLRESARTTVCNSTVHYSLDFAGVTGTLAQTSAGPPAALPMRAHHAMTNPAPTASRGLSRSLLGYPLISDRR